MGNDYENKKTLVLVDSDSGEETVISETDFIHQKANVACKYNQHFECDVVKDLLSQLLHGRHYTAMVPMEDYKTNRSDVVRYLQRRYGYRTYLEIGCFEDEVFDMSSQLFDSCTGVDPVAGGTHRMTSDDFFKSNTQHFDLIFIDGDHEANQVVRDINNALRWLAPNGTIVMHDCNPRAEGLQVVPYDDTQMAIWLGDTWKAVVAHRLRKDIEVVVVDADFGVGVIRKRENKHPLPQEWIDLLGINPVSVLTYPMLKENRQVFHRLMSMSDLDHWLDEELLLD